MHYAIKESGVDAEVIAAVDINTSANLIYMYNFPETTIINKTLESMSVEEFDKLQVDILLLSPPCQPYCGVGKQLDVEDGRAKSFLYLLQILPKLKILPKYIFLENVKGFDVSKSRDLLLKCMMDLRYDFQEFLLTPLQFGIPNSRLRYYFMAKQKSLPFKRSGDLQTSIPEEMKTYLKFVPVSCEADVELNCSSLASSRSQCQPLEGFLEKLSDEKFSELLLPEKLIPRFWVMDLVKKNSLNTCCFTKRYGHHMEGSGSLLITQPEKTDYLLMFKEKKQFTEEVQETVRNLKIRFFSPREIANIMCFPKEFTWSENLTNKQMYRVLGNSLNVHVVACLLKYLIGVNDH